MALADIDTIVFAMMENRSFDHLLGYLSLADAPVPMPVDGLRSDPAWNSEVANVLLGTPYSPRPMSTSLGLADPPHDRASIAMQIDTAPAGPGRTQMGGFVESYFRFVDPTPTNLGAVMGYHDGDGVPVFDFLARNYCVCDHWFSSVPLGTQANRLMAMAGESLVLDNASSYLPYQRLVYDWLTDAEISWCVYLSGDFLPFFALMPKWLLRMGPSLTLSQLGVSGVRFRRYRRFREEWMSGTAPSIIFVEPEYTDGLGRYPNDDHPPTRIDRGQDLIGDLYRTLTANPGRWERTLLVITYDEHGGFFDHVEPPLIPTLIQGVKLTTLGVRVPALLISPHVAPGKVFSDTLDHTSILQLLADRFRDGRPYSDRVNERSGELGRISDALLRQPRPGPAPRLPPGPLEGFRTMVRPVVKALTRNVDALARTPPPTPNALAMDRALRDLAETLPGLLRLSGWEEARAYLRRNPVPLAEREQVAF